MQPAGPNIEALFFAARELKSPEARSAYLDEVCSDLEARRRIEQLLAVDPEANDFLAAPAPMPTATATLDSRSVVEESGTLIGPYKLLEPIGEGGMGTVYMAEQYEPVRRRVALKVIKPGMDSKQVVARFKAERQALAMMDHPNIAKVLDGGMTPSGRPYFVMELVRGLPITEYCDQEQLSIPERLELFTLVCRAVQHAHQKGVIHRDLKPSNVLVTEIDGVATPKVIDFGVAKATGQSLTDKTLFTGFHQFVGTPLYVSPEQVKLSGADVDTRSDIYSLGVLLYELLTGTTPFDPETLKRAAFDEMRRIICEEEPSRPSTRLSSLGERLTTVSARRKADPKRLGASVMGELDWVVMKALEKDRRRRYETANDFAADVMNYLADRPVEAHPPSAWYRIGKFARRNRVALITTTVVAVSLVGGTAFSIWQATRAMRSEQQAEERSRLARQAVDEMYTQIAEKWLGDQPALTKLQRDFLEKALALYQRLASEEAPDPQASHEEMRALLRVGAIREALGQHAEAEAAWREVVARGADLVRQYPGRPELRLDLAEGRIRRERSLGKIGLTEAERRMRIGVTSYRSEPTFALVSHKEADSSDAEREILQASRELASLKTAFAPTDAEARRRLAEAQGELCSALTRARRLPEAEAAAQASSATWESLAKEFPGEIEYRLGLARTYSKQGMHFMWWGTDIAKAEVALRQAEVMLSELQKGRPGDARIRRDLVGALGNLGVILGWAGRHAERESLERRRLPLAEGLAADFPDVPDYRYSLFLALRNLAQSIRDQGRSAESEGYARRAVAIAEKLAESHPDVPDYHSVLVHSLGDLSLDLKRRGDLRGARQVWERCVLGAREFLKLHLRDLSAYLQLANSLAGLANTDLELGDHDAAAAAAEELARIDLSGREPREKALLAVVAAERLIRCAASAEQDAKLSPERRRAAVQDYARRLEAVVQEAATAQGSGDCEVLYRLADLLTHRPGAGMWDPQLAVRLARKATELKPDDYYAVSSLGSALYRAGDWRGCLAAAKPERLLREGGYIAAMAYWRLGEKAEARSAFDRQEAMWQRQMKRLAKDQKEGGTFLIYHDPALVEFLRAEAAALLGVSIGPQAELNDPRTQPVGGSKPSNRSN